MPSVINPKLRDMMGIFGMFNEEKDKKKCNSAIFSILKTKKGQWAGNEMQWLEILSFRERRCALSLDFWLFGSSVLDGARSKVSLRG